MAKFIIKYNYARYHTGAINENLTRKAVVYASKLEDAYKKVSELDNACCRIADNGVEIEETGEFF